MKISVSVAAATAGLVLVAAAGTAWAVMADIRLPWEPRPFVWEIASITCEAQRDRVWRRQDYLQQEQEKARAKKDWAGALKRQKQIREQEKVERRINKTCDRYDEAKK